LRLINADIVETPAALRRLTNCRAIIIIIILTLGINVPEKGLKKLVKMKRLGMSKIPCGHKRAYFHVKALKR